MWKEAGIKILPVVASTALAKMVERAGVDAVIAEGGESGGHVGDLTTMALVPQVVDAVHIPVVAAGGIGDGRGMVARSHWAPAACRWGRASSLRDECTVSDEYKRKFSPRRISPRRSQGAVWGTPSVPSKTRT